MDAKLLAEFEAARSELEASLRDHFAYYDDDALARMFQLLLNEPSHAISLAVVNGGAKQVAALAAATILAEITRRLDVAILND